MVLRPSKCFITGWGLSRAQRETVASLPMLPPAPLDHPLDEEWIIVVGV